MAPAKPRPAALIAAGVALLVTASAQAEIRIGFAHPLSGPFASTGHRQRVAAELAVRDINRDGGLLGRQVELVVADDACGIERAAGAAKTLIGAEVEVVIGHMCSHSSLIAAGYYETAGVLMITPNSTHPRLTEEGRRNVFRVIGRDDRQGALAAGFLAERFPEERIAILHDGSTYGAGLARETRQSLHERGIRETMFARYKPGAEDYRPIAERMIAADIGVAYVGGYGPDAARILKGARELEAEIRVIGGDGLSMDEFWTIAGEEGEGTVFSDRVPPPPTASRLLARFARRGLGERPGGVGAYAAVEVWAEAVERAGSSETGMVANLLRRGNFDTVLGRLSFDPKGDLEDAGWTWHVWRDGSYELLDSPATQ